MARSLVVFLLFASSLAAQTPVAVQDPSFESGTPNPPSFGWYNSSVAGWTCTGSGQWEPAMPSNFSSVPDGNAIIYMASGSCSQDLGIVPTVNSTYTLSVSVGHRVGNNLVSPYMLALNAGTTQLCSVSDTNSTIAQGAWITKTLTCTTGATVPSGNLTIVISDTQNQAAFDHVLLTVQPTVSVTVTVSPSTATILAGQTGTFTATSSDSSSLNWTVTSGSVSPANSANGAQVTYTAPASAGTVTLTACSATTPSACGSATVTVPHQAALSWTDTANPAGSVTYSVLRASATNGQCPAALNSIYTLLASNLTVMNYTDTTIQPNLEYCYEVQAVSNSQMGIAGIVLFIPGSVNTITVSAMYPWWYDKLVSPINTLKVS